MKQREMKNKQRREVAKGTRGSPSRKDVRWEAETGWTDGWRQWGRSFPRPSLWPIRIKLAGPWQRLGRTVGHEDRGGRGMRGGEGRKGENFLVIKTKWLVVSEAEGWGAGVTWACREGEGRSNSNETNLPSPRHHPRGLTPPSPLAPPLLRRLHFSPLTVFSPFPRCFLFTLSPFACLSLCFPPVYAWTRLPVVNTITIYYCLSPSARAHR